MSHRPGHDGIAEILASGQFPGTAIREPVRSAYIRDAAGRGTRILYAGQEDTGSLDRDLYKVAAEEGIDLSTAKVTATMERGQGVGAGGRYNRKNRPVKPTRSKGRATPEQR